MHFSTVGDWRFVKKQQKHWSDLRKYCTFIASLNDVNTVIYANTKHEDSLT